MKRDSFDMNADFDSASEYCASEYCVCECCVYRQYIRGVFRNAAGDTIDFQLPDGLLDETEYAEDGIPNEWGLGEHGFYGHRERPALPYDKYLPNQRDGCEYRGSDTVTCGVTETLHAEFIGLIVDTCEGKIVDVRTWVVHL